MEYAIGLYCFIASMQKVIFSLCEFIDSAIDQNKVPEIVSPESVLLSHLKMKIC